MPRCRNRDCKAKLPKGTLPQVCDDACRDAAISQALEKKRAADKRAAARARNLVEREAKEQRKEFRRKKIEFYERDITTQLRLTQKAVNRLVALLDNGQPCIACGRPDEGGRKRHASHLKSIGANSALRFDLRNIHGSCVVCNQHLSGNVTAYRDGLARRYGDAIVVYLYTAPQLKKWTPQECIEIRRTINAEIRRLEKGLGPSKDWRSIQSQEARLAGRGEQEMSVA